MNSMELLSDTDIAQAKLVSHLSGRPAKVQEDVFVWNGHLIDRATAIVALLKINNQVPVSDGVKLRLKENYERKFAAYRLTEDLADINDDNPPKAARVWFSVVCHIIKGSIGKVSNDVMKQILIDLHRQ